MGSIRECVNEVRPSTLYSRVSTFICKVKGVFRGLVSEGLVFIRDGILKLVMVAKLFDSVNWSQLIPDAYKCDSFVCSLLS